MSVLRRAWDQATGGECSLVLLLGESRLGKTRIVQEFYSWISQNRDPAHYWPNWLQHERGNLAINPRFSEESDRAGEMPWLWWGLRWSRPDLRNAAETRHCAVLEGEHHIRPHLQSVIRRREEAKTGWQVGLSGLNTLLGAIPVIGFLSGVKDVVEHSKAYVSIQRAKEREAAKVATLRAEESKDALMVLADLMTALLGSNAIQPGGLPVVLILDDAQWIDPESLRFLRGIMQPALTRKWPLLVIATHWEQEWNRDEIAASGTPAATSRSTFSHLIRTLPLEREKNYHLLPVLPLPDLRSIITAALPGLTAGQVQKLADRAGGNPGLLHEILLHYQANPRYFVGRDAAEQLTADAESDLARRVFSLQELVQQRFSELGETIRDVLGIGSYQGFRFSDAITTELAESLFQERSAGQDLAAAALKAANHPHAIVQPVATGTSEFRQSVFHAVALDYFQVNSEELSRFQSRLRGVLEQRLATPMFDRLSAQDQEALARLATRELRGVAGPNADGNDPRLEAHAALAICLWQSHRFMPLKAAWAEWYALVKPDLNAAARRLDLDRLSLMANIAAEISEPVVAADLGSIHLERERAKITDDAESQIAVSSSLLDLSNLCQVAGRETESRAHAAESVRLRLEVIQKFGKTTERSALLAQAYNHLGWVQYAQGKHAEAERFATKAVDTIRELIAIHGENADWAESLAVYSNNLGHVLTNLDAIKRGTALLRVGLQWARAQLSNTGVGPQKQGLVYSFIRNNALQELRMGNGTAAKALALESISLARRMIADFGPSEHRQVHLANGLALMVKTYQELGEPGAALDFAIEEVGIELGLLRDFGAMRPRVNALAIALNNQGYCLLHLDRHPEAESILRESIRVKNDYIATYGAGLDTLREKSTTLCNLGETVAELNRPDEALQLFREAVKLDRRAIQDYGRTGQSVRELQASLKRVAHALQVKGVREEAEQTFAECVRLAAEYAQLIGTNRSSIRVILDAASDLAYFLHAHRDFEKAEQVIVGALKLQPWVLRSKEPDAPSMANLSNLNRLLGDIYYLQKRNLPPAEEAYTRSLRIARKMHALWPDDRSALECLADIAWRWGCIEDGMKHHSIAVSLLIECLQCGRKLVALNPGSEQHQMRLAHGALNLAVTLQAVGKPEEAKALLNEAMDINRRIIREHGPSPERLFNQAYVQRVLIDAAG